VRSEVSCLRQQSLAWPAERKRLADEIEAVRTKLREQTEADILLVSMRIQHRILSGEKPTKDDPDVMRQQMLSNQLDQMRNMSNVCGQSGIYSPLGAFLGSLGGR
jgi:hypothetical protein